MSKKVGQIIKARREHLNLTKSALARRLGCSPQNIDSLENRKSIDFELAERMCEVLDFDLFAYYRGQSNLTQSDPSEFEAKLQEINNKYTQLLEKYTLLLERITTNQLNLKV
jgi:transcriptional regulator with XRE-family HTH domain